MCKSFIEIDSKGKVIRRKGAFRKGRWLFCLECGIVELGKNRSVKSIRSLAK